MFLIGWRHAKRKEIHMAIFEFSDDFDAVGFYMEQMQKDEDWDYYHAQWDE